MSSKMEFVFVSKSIPAINQLSTNKKNKKKKNLKIKKDAQVLAPFGMWPHKCLASHSIFYQRHARSHIGKT